MLKTSGFPDGPQIEHLLDVDPDERRRRHGRGTAEALDSVIAGHGTTIRFTYQIGQMAVQPGGRLRVAWLWPLDWAPLQADDPSADGYVRIQCSRADVVFDTEYVFRNDLIPWNHHLQVTLRQGQLQPGDRVELVCGCRDGGGGGWRAPAFTVPDVGFLLLLDPDGGDTWWQLAPEPQFAIDPCEPAALVALAPSQAIPGEEVTLTLRVEDEWGNARLVDGDAPRCLTADVDADPAQATPGQPAYACVVRFRTTGTQRLTFEIPGTRLQATTNPVRVTETPTQTPIFWGDLHAGQGEIGCGVGSIPHHFDYARYVSGLQFCSHQANDHHVTRDMWEQTRRESAEAHEEGRFVAYLGCEWSGFTPDGGDRNVFYRYDETQLRRSGRFFTEDVADPEPDRTTAAEFLALMRDKEVYVNMHAGGRPTNLDVHEPAIEPLAEIHSTHGTSEWFVEDALRRGYRIGITAGTDGVAGRPGSDHPSNRQIRNVRSGVTAMIARSLTHDALWDAIGSRSCYATSGPRMLLHVDVDGQPMGSQFDTDGEPLICLLVDGTAAIEQVDLMCGVETLASWTIAPPEPARRLRLLWGGTQSKGTSVDQRAPWDATFTVRHGRLRDVETIAFITPDDQAEQVDASTLRLRSVTAGNDMGVLLDLECGADTVCRFESAHRTFEFSPAQVQHTPMTVDAGGWDRRIVVGPAPDVDAPTRVELSTRDTRAVSGECAYWVRVTQVDRHRAWSTPVYVTRR